jgi:predicted TIM-barrel fold metal-dependent hydrolase
MSDVIDRPILEKEATAATRLRIIDCDIHPSLRSRADLNDFLPKRWQEHLKTYGDHLRTPYIGTTPYPRSSPLICRRDAWPPTGGGWPSYYCEEHQSNAHSMAANLASLVIEGVLERFPKLKIVYIEGGFGWIPSAMWRMDQHFERFRSEVPHLKRKPSEYVREHFWFTTQPIDEPDDAKHLRQLIEWVGVDRLLFSSDYPHWDYDDARFAFKTPLTDVERKKIFNSNARAVYKL